MADEKEVEISVSVTWPSEAEAELIKDGEGKVTGVRLKPPFYSSAMSDPILYSKVSAAGEVLQREITTVCGRTLQLKHSDRSKGTVTPSIYSSRKRKAKPEEDKPEEDKPEEDNE